MLICESDFFHLVPRARMRGVLFTPPIHPYGLVRRGGHSLPCDLSSILAVMAVRKVY